MDPSVTFFALNQVGEGAKVHVANVGMHSTGTRAVKLRSNSEATGFLEVCGSRVPYHYGSLLSPNLEVGIEFGDVVLAHSAF